MSFLTNWRLFLLSLISIYGRVTCYVILATTRRNVCGFLFSHYHFTLLTQVCDWPPNVKNGNGQLFAAHCLPVPTLAQPTAQSECLGSRNGFERLQQRLSAWCVMPLPDKRLCSDSHGVGGVSVHLNELVCCERLSRIEFHLKLIAVWFSRGSQMTGTDGEIVDYSESDCRHWL